ncbi:MAG: phosphatase PAP2 family protein [Gemmatimonadota bacterium]|nr:phosphatase PAP2 family protein [Gemmatimonadota bacterium]
MADRLQDRSSGGPLLTYVALGSTVLFAILTVMVIARQTNAFDHDMILSLRAGARPWLTTMMLAITFVSGRLAVPAVIIFAIALYYRSGVRASSYYLGACLAAQLLNVIIKYGVERPRPHNVSPHLTAAGGMAYPSADAMLAVVVFGLGTYMVTETIRPQAMCRVALALSAAFIVLAAIARVYLGAHWPTDVVGGVLAGVACATFCITALRRPPEMPIPVSAASAALVAR